MNHLTLTLKAEEPEITTIAIRPGMVDTEMQRELREIHAEKMDKKDSEKFGNAKTSGTLAPPEKPGHVIAKLALDAPSELSGEFIRYVSTHGRGVLANRP